MFIKVLMNTIVAYCIFFVSVDTWPYFTRYIIYFVTLKSDTYLYVNSHSFELNVGDACTTFVLVFVVVNNIFALLSAYIGMWSYCTRWNAKLFMWVYYTQHTHIVNTNITRKKHTGFRGWVYFSINGSITPCVCSTLRRVRRASHPVLGSISSLPTPINCLFLKACSHVTASKFGPLKF